MQSVEDTWRLGLELDWGSSACLAWLAQLLDLGVVACWRRQIRVLCASVREGEKAGWSCQGRYELSEHLGKHVARSGGTRLMQGLGCLRLQPKSSGQMKSFGFLARLTVAG